jgi:D-amino-acid dehydrogenase
VHSCVLGAGIIGVTTAYQLLMAGHEVTLIDAQDNVAQMTSLGNGAQLSYSYVAPLADASIWKKWPEYLFSATSPLTFKPQFDTLQWRWLAQFLSASNTTRAKKTSAQLLKLAQHSQRQIEILMRDEQLNFHHNVSGKLVMLSDRASIDSAAAQIAFQAQYGCEQSIVDMDACLRLEPALAHAQHRWLAGVYTRSEAVGDCAEFCQGLMKVMLQSTRFQFLPNTRVVGVEKKADQLSKVKLVFNKKESYFSADNFILTLGAESVGFASHLGFKLPIYPLKGYSITVPITATESAAAPHISITDLSQKIVYARLGDQLRVAGRVELVGNNLSISSKTIAELVAATRNLFPDSGDLSNINSLSPWAGMRPATPTGVPIIGQSPVRNVYLNVGHGALGWTLACGSAALIRDLICGGDQAIDSTPFAFA